MSWKTIDGVNLIGTREPELDTLLRGIFKKDILLELIRQFIVYEKEKSGTSKKLAAYHQF